MAPDNLIDFAIVLLYFIVVFLKIMLLRNINQKINNSNEIGTSNS